MSYNKYYAGGWQSGEVGATPITPEALNHIEDGITQTYEDLAAKTHGNHVPTVQTADDATFLRNDNTWQKVTPANIGAVPTSRKVNGKDLSADVTLSASDVGAAASSHNQSASTITSGTLPVARGGTGVTSNPSMLINLASTSAASVFAASPRPGVTGTLPIANGGTGATSAANARKNIGLDKLTTLTVVNSSPVGLLQAVKNMYGAMSADINYIEYINDGGGRKTIIGVKYGNYGYFIAFSLDGVYMYRNYNGSWSEKQIGSY